MKQYLSLLNELYTKAVNLNEYRENRTKIATSSIFGHQMSFDLGKGLPLLTTKKLYLKAIIHELLWFISGSTNIKYLNDNDVHIWDAWAKDNGELGPIYGKQWRQWCGNDGKIVDQLTNVIEEIKTNPYSRRLIVSSWNVSELNDMTLMPCHLLFQFYVDKGKLSCQLYQRSADVFLGVPFNIASYSILTYMVAQQCNLKPGKFIWTGGDCHLYFNHLAQARMQLKRTPLLLPKLTFKRKPDSLFEYKYEDIDIENYVYYPSIKADVAI